MMLFDGIEIEEINSMLSCLKPQIAKYSKGECIVLTGDDFDRIGIILEGEASVMKENVAGNSIMMTLLTPGDMFGEIVAYSLKKVWPATVYAQGDCTVLFMPPDKIVGSCNNACPKHKKLIQNMLKIVSEKALLLNRKVEYLTIKSMRDRISAFLLEQQKKLGNNTFQLPFNRNEMADFLNVSRPSLSREMCKMRNEGIIDFHRDSIRILNMKELKNISE